MLVGRFSEFLIALQAHLFQHWHFCCRLFEHLLPSSSQFHLPCSFLDNTLTDYLFDSCYKLFVSDGSADLEVSKRSKKQTHSVVLLSIYPATDSCSRFVILSCICCLRVANSLYNQTVFGAMSY